MEGEASRGQAAAKVVGVLAIGAGCLAAVVCTLVALWKIPPPAPDPANARPVAVVDATALCQEYADNEVAADAKYAGKVVEVTGKVDSVRDGYALVRGPGRFDLWIYPGRKDAERLKALVPGQAIRVRGVCEKVPFAVTLRKAAFID